MNPVTYYEKIDALPEGNTHLGMGYVAGWVLSLVCTLGAYELVMGHHFETRTLIFSLFTLACFQFLIQIVFFLHLSLTPSSRQKLFIFGYTIFIVLTLFVGSLWVMLSLNNRMMPSPEVMRAYMQKQIGL